MKRIIFSILASCALVAALSFTVDDQRRQLIWDRVMANGTPNMVAGWDANGNPAEVTPGGTSGGSENELQRADGNGGFEGIGIFSDDPIGRELDAGANNWSLKYNGLNRITIASGGILVGHDLETPDAFNRLHVTANSTTGITHPLKLSMIDNNGGITAGIGVGMTFDVNTNGSSREEAAYIEAVSTDVTPGSEDFELLFKTMKNGALATTDLTVSSAGIQSNAIYATGSASRASYRFGSLTSDPSSLQDGDVWFNSTSAAYKCRLNSGTTNIFVTSTNSGFVTNGIPFQANTIGQLNTETAFTYSANTLNVGNVRLQMTGSNASVGTAVLVAGTVTVSTTQALTNSVILLTCQVPGGTPGFLHVSSRVNGTSFTITSSSGSDTSTVGWLIINDY